MTAPAAPGLRAGTRVHGSSRRGILRALLAAGAALLLVGASHATAGPGPAPAHARLLFIGNSLTYVNDLPGMVARVAAQAGYDGVETESIARPDFSLEDHWRDGTALARLAAQRFDFVVMQQGPSSLPESRAHLTEWSLRFAGPIRRAGAVPVLYMVWPAASRPGDFAGVAAAYRLAADTTHGLLAPAGLAWREAQARDASVPLYSRDGFHPSVAGTYLAALVIAARTLHVRPLDLPAVIPGADAEGVPAERVRELQRAAQAVL